jgi:hypothetical protein
MLSDETGSHCHVEQNMTEERSLLDPMPRSDEIRWMGAAKIWLRLCEWMVPQVVEDAPVDDAI